MSARDPAVVSGYASLLLALGIPKRRKRLGRHRSKAAKPASDKTSGLSFADASWISFLQNQNRRTRD